MTCFFRACHGKMPLNAIYTSNDLFFRVVSRENVIKSHVQVKLHVCLGACHGKMPYIHQITCFLGACHGKMPYIHQITCFLGRGTEKCHIYIHQITCLFRGVSRENIIKFHVYVNWRHMEVNDIAPDTPLKCCNLTCTCYLVAFSGDAPRQIYLWTCTWNLITFSPDALLKTSFDVYMEFNDIFTWRAPKTCHLTCTWNFMIFSRENVIWRVHRI